MNSKKLLNDLEEIVNKGLEDSAIPVAKGNSIRIKHIVIRESSKGYLIYNAKENKQIAKTQFKSTAIAIAKNLAQGKDITEKAMEFDITLLKHYNDALFYKNSIKKSKDPIITEIRISRLNVAIHESQKARAQLDRYIFC
jgi:hypothetical protein